MKLVRPCTPLIQSIQAELNTPFNLIDVGCAFGIDTPFIDFGDKLFAVGFEPSLEECERLQSNNNNPCIRYVPAFVKLDPEHPFARLKAGKSHWSNNPWDHLAVAFTLANMRKAQLSGSQKSALNLWADTPLAQPVSDVYLDQYLPLNGIDSVDLCKIDVDGADFEILHSLERYFQDKKVLAVVVEVNYFGSDNNTDHTFHNVDRYMRQQGFDLYGLTINKYSAQSLPSHYFFAGPGENVGGRPYQGDALYVLDYFSEPLQLTRDRLLKLVAIFALFDLPDWAAEILRKCGGQHVEPTYTNQLLELLARQIQEGAKAPLRYADYMAAFERNDPYFYPADIAISQDGRDRSALLADIHRLRAEIEVIKDSKSWKITAPLRQLSHLFGKLNK